MSICHDSGASDVHVDFHYNGGDHLAYSCIRAAQILCDMPRGTTTLVRSDVIVGMEKMSFCVSQYSDKNSLLEDGVDRWKKTRLMKSPKTVC